MLGKFYLSSVSRLVESMFDPKDTSFPIWNRKIIYKARSREYYSELLKSRTGVAIFGPSQDVYLEAFEKAPVKILYKSKKCVNPNHRGQAPEQRNTVVVFEELK